MVKKIGAIILALVLCLLAAIVPVSATGATLGDAKISLAFEWDKEYYNAGDKAVLSIYMDADDSLSLYTGSILIGLNSAVFSPDVNTQDALREGSTTAGWFNAYYTGADVATSILAATIVSKVQAKNTTEENADFDWYIKYTAGKNGSGWHDNTANTKAGFGGDGFVADEPIVTYTLTVNEDVADGTLAKAAITSGSLTSVPVQTSWKYYKTPNSATTTANVTATTIDYSQTVATATVGKAPCADNAHQWDNGKVTTEPTCGKEGVTTYTCTKCNHTKEERNVPATGNHTAGDPVQENVVPASCDKAGSYDAVVYCTVCNAEISRTATPIPATGKHNFATETGRQEPTCTEDGYVEMSCGCGEKEKTTLPKTGHTEVVDAAVAPTCKESGLTEGSHCDVCGEVLVAQTEVPAAGHDYDSVVTPPTCTEGGYTTYTCSVCGDNYKADETTATGHDYKEEVTKKPTCTRPGETTYTCSGCGDNYTEDLPELGHTLTTEAGKEATCTEPGYTAREWCTVCNTVTTQKTEIPALGHSYTTVVTPPTCTAAGYTTYTCSVCNDSYTGDEVAALGHTEGDVPVVENEVEATCTTAGSYDNVYFCTVCNEEVRRETVTVEPTGHTPNEGVVTAPTCTEDGYTTYTCTVCNETYTDDETEALGHTEDEAPVVENEVEATCTEDGSYDNVYFCSECGEEASRETVIVEATGHSYDDGVVTAPTETEEGYTTYTCTECGDSFEDDFVPALGAEDDESKEDESVKDETTDDKDETTDDEKNEVTDVIIPDTDSLQVVSPMILLAVLAFVLMATTIVLKKKRRE